MACAMVYWGRQYDKFFQVFIEFGAVVDICNLQGEQIGTEERCFISEKRRKHQEKISCRVTGCIECEWPFVRRDV